MFNIILNVFSSDVVFCWFASVYAFVGVFCSKITGAKSVIVVGGVDVAKEPELKYGIWLSPWKSVLVRYALRNATYVLVVDPGLKEDAIRLAQYEGRNILYLPTGYDSAFWKPPSERGNVVLTVAHAGDLPRFRVKGIDILIESARLLPEIEFVVVGVDFVLVEKFNPPANMTFHSTTERKNLLPFYRYAKVYCQPSRREGLSNTLCEAMLCGCIPVATDVGGNRAAVGDAGFLIPANDSKLLGAALKEAIQSDTDRSAKARSRIVGLFPKEKRERELLKIIQGLIE